MGHKVIVKDYEILHGEGCGWIKIGDVKLRVFISGMRLVHLLYKENYRGKEIEAELKILPGYVDPVDIKKKMILELTGKDKLVPKYLFIGEVLKNKDKGNGEITVIFDCGVTLEVNAKKDYFFEKLKEGDYILVIGFLHIYSVRDVEK